MFDNSNVCSFLLNTRFTHRFEKGNVTRKRKEKRYDWTWVRM